MSGGLASRLRALFGRRRPAPAAPVQLGSLADELFGSASSNATTTATVPSGLAATGGWRTFRLVTASGGLVVAPSGGGALAIGRASEADHAVLAIVPDALPHVCFLMAAGGAPVAVAPDERQAVAVSARILITDLPGVVRLRYPVSGSYFLEVQPPAASGALGLRFDGAGNSLLATFNLKAVEQSAVPEAVAALAAELAGAAGHLHAEDVLESLRLGRLRPALAEPVIRLLPEDELAELVRLARSSSADLALLGQAMPGDLWVGERLPALAAWQRARVDVPGHEASSPAAEEADLLAAAGAALVPAGLALHALARHQVLPRRRACVLAAARNEGPYLLDWIAYHLSIGFEHVFLYSNENADGSDALLSLLARHGVITLVRNERSARLGPQLKGYTHALTMLPQILDFGWAALLDINEYLGFDARLFGGVADFLAVQESQRVDSIALCGLMFAGLPEDRWSEASTPARFVRRERDVQPLVKSLIRPNRFWHSQPHFPTASLDATFEYRSADGGVHHHRHATGRSPAESPHPSAEQAWVNHYMLRSAEEALWKWGRGRGDLAGPHPDATVRLDRLAEDFLRLARPEHLVTDRRILACARGQEAVLERLRALPGVGVCEAEVKARFGAQLAANARAFLDAGLPVDASASVRHFVEIVKEGLLF